MTFVVVGWQVGIEVCFEKKLQFQIEIIQIMLVSGMAGLLAGHPIDTLKVRQQILGRPMIESIVNIHRAGGVLSNVNIVNPSNYD